MAAFQRLDNDLKKIVLLVLEDLAKYTDCSDSTQIESYYGEMKILLDKFNTKIKLLSLKDRQHRAIVVQLISKRGLKFYNYSYLNRAKLAPRHIELLKEVGPFLFVEGLMIVSKMNVIYKHFSTIIIEDYSYQGCDSSVDAQIIDILKMCDEKKRTVNNNLKKLDFLFKFPETRTELIKELGKMLRDSWKKQKSKHKINDTLCLAKHKYIAKPQLYSQANEKDE